MAIDLAVDHAEVFEVLRLRELVVDRVVVRADVVDRMRARHVQHAPLAQQLVDGHADQERRLADAVSRDHHPQIAGAEAAVQALLEQPQRAARVQESSLQKILRSYGLRSLSARCAKPAIHRRRARAWSRTPS
jgi:hypothetical protein